MTPSRPAAVGAVVVVLGLILAGCGQARAAPDSGVAGLVWVGPMCPVVQEGVDCPDQPLEADLEVADADGKIVARVRSEADGSYRIPLEEGSYLLIPLSPGEAGLPFASPIPFEVAPGAWAELDVHYDSGIR
jgi:hypothetical protein